MRPYFLQLLSRAARNGSWCRMISIRQSHLDTYHFQSVIFHTNSQSVLTLLSSAPGFLQAKLLWHVYFLANSLASSIAPKFQWFPTLHTHAGLPKTRRLTLLPKPEQDFLLVGFLARLPLPLKVRTIMYYNVPDSNILSCQIPPVSSKELALFRSACCEHSHPHYHGYSRLFIFLYLSIHDKIGEYYLQRLRTLSTGYFSFSTRLSCIQAFRRAIFGNISSFFNIWSRSWGVARFLGFRGVSWVSVEFPHAPFLRKGSGNTNQLSAVLFNAGCNEQVFSPKP